MNRKVSVIGLGYVGLPVAVAFGQRGNVVAFDVSRRRIDSLRQGYDYTLEVEDDILQSARLLLSDNPEDLKQADFHIIAVPTPIDESHKPDLTPLLSASALVGSVLKRGDIVVFESTVYPGVTEDKCVPVLEKHSGLVCGDDFFVGYSPERINPGDKAHTFTNVTKVVSGQNSEICDIIADVYGSVVTAGIYKASSIKVAEAAKVIENTQRDINIAFVNELYKIFQLMNINTHEVLEAAGTKWNFLNFKPGLVGGHCIGVDPYYLTHKAESLGYHPQVILSGRRINDGMGKYIAETTIKEMVKKNMIVKDSRVAILGLTFKENCPDVRNTRVIDIIDELKSYDIKTIVIDEMADKSQAKELYDIQLQPLSAIDKCNVVILAVAHESFKSEDIRLRLSDKAVVVDIKNIYPKLFMPAVHSTFQSSREGVVL